MATNADQDQVGFDKMLDGAIQRMAEVGKAVMAVGEPARTTFNALEATAKAMVSTGQRAADAILAGRADERVRFENDTDRALRLSREGNIASGAGKLIGNGAESLQKFAKQLEDHDLVGALLPAPAKEDSRRLLTWKGIEQRYAHLDGDRLESAIRQRLGENPSHDSELLSDLGTDFASGKGLSELQMQGLRTHAVEVYIKRVDGSNRQQAARTALTRIRELNLAGHLSAFPVAARRPLDQVGATWTPSRLETRPATGRDLRG